MKCTLLAITLGLGKSRQVDGDGNSWQTSYWQLGYASLGKSRQVGGDGTS